MKTKILSLSLVSLLCGSAAFAQSSSVATNPVGFISITVAPGTPQAPVSTLVSPTLTNPISFQSTVTSVSGTTIAINGAAFSANQFNGSNGEYYVEVLASKQSGAGVLADITATASNSVTTAQDISSMVTAGDTVIIRQHITLNQFLGVNNTYHLLGSSDYSTADLVTIYNGSTNAVYWYYDGSFGGTAGWYDLNFNPSGAITIAPSEGVVITRKASPAVTIVSTGTVVTGNTLFPVSSGVNVLGTTSAQGLTLATSGLYNGTSGLTASSDYSTADLVTIYTSTTGGTTTSEYWYYDGSYGGTAGWYDLNFNPSGSIALNPGNSIVVSRKYGSAFNWSVPAPSSF